jgi:DNA replication protein DnaC
MEVSMLTHPTHERLITLGLAGMAKALEEQRQSPDLDALSFEERVGLLVDREAAERDTKRLTTRLKFAALRQSACVENIDWNTPRGIDRAVFARLFGGDWIDRNENLLITGARRGEMIAREPEPSSQPSPPAITAIAPDRAVANARAQPQGVTQIT